MAEQQSKLSTAEKVRQAVSAEVLNGFFGADQTMSDEDVARAINRLYQGPNRAIARHVMGLGPEKKACLGLDLDARAHSGFEEEGLNLFLADGFNQSSQIFLQFFVVEADFTDDGVNDRGISFGFPLQLAF